jgi:hypothetical protein
MMRSGKFDHLRAGVVRPACLLRSATIDDHMWSASALVGSTLPGDGEVRAAPIGVRLAGSDALSWAEMPDHMTSIESCVTGTPCFNAIEFPMARRVVMVVMTKIPGQ